MRIMPSCLEWSSSGNTSTPVVTMNEIELSGEVQLSSLGVQIFPRMR